MISSKPSRPKPAKRWSKKAGLKREESRLTADGEPTMFRAPETRRRFDASEAALFLGSSAAL